MSKGRRLLLRVLPDLPSPFTFVRSSHLPAASAGNTHMLILFSSHIFIRPRSNSHPTLVGRVGWIEYRAWTVKYLAIISYVLRGCRRQARGGRGL